MIILVSNLTIDNIWVQATYPLQCRRFMSTHYFKVQHHFSTCPSVFPETITTQQTPLSIYGFFIHLKIEMETENRIDLQYCVLPTYDMRTSN